MGQDNTLLIGGAAVVGLGFLAYQNGWLDQFIGPSIPTDVISSASQKAFIAMARLQGATDEQIQAKFDEIVAAKKNCAAPGTWNVKFGSCDFALAPPITGGGVYVPAPPTPQNPVVPTVLPSTSDPSVSALIAAAAGDVFFVGGKGNADQWAFYWNKTHSPLTGDQFLAAFPNRAALLTANEFVGSLRNIGLSGLGLRIPRVQGGIPASLMGIRVPGLGAMVNSSFYGTTVPAQTIDSELEQIESGWERAWGNSTGFADAGIQRDPATCAAALRDSAASHCALYSEACAGYNVEQIIASLCSKYGSWFQSTFPKGWGNAWGSNPPPYAALPDTPNGATQILIAQSQPSYQETYQTPASIPVQVQQLLSPTPIATNAPPVSLPAALTTTPKPSTSTSAGNGAGSQISDLIEGTTNIAGYDIPTLALAGVAVVGLYMFMKGGR